ncbi:hypothetical protein AB0F17_23520 [Nonomuraea sp. NPDC026600]|uniref:hypothetical protein n=1 Tax=Nonomuraea sp. NPDC026600 TaxID=3155363 RepID=UPI0033E0CDE9
MVGLWAVGLPVWCEWDQTFGWRYRWWTDTNTDTGDRKFAQCAGIATDTAVRRIVDRYWELHGALVASPKLRVPGENAVSTGG